MTELLFCVWKVPGLITGAHTAYRKIIVVSRSQILRSIKKRRKRIVVHLYLLSILYLFVYLWFNKDPVNDSET
jgi:polyferredoxin